MIYMSTGSLDANILGPFADRGQDDVSQLTNFLSAAPHPPNGLFIEGDGFATSELSHHPAFITGWLAATTTDPSYSVFDPGACTNLYTVPPASPAPAAFGVANGPAVGNDVLVALTTGVLVGQYASGYGAAVYHPATAGQNWLTQLDGWGTQNQLSPACTSNAGRVTYLQGVLAGSFAAACATPGPDGWFASVPRDSSMRDAVALGPNPATGGRAEIQLTLARANGVDVGVFDVSGRRLATLLDRALEGGRHVVRWDGTDAGHRALRSGVYFVRTQFRSGGFRDVRTLVLLR